MDPINITLELRTELAPSTRIDLPSIRQGIARLMDDAAAQITRLGYDLDDCVCERFIEARPSDSADVFISPCEAFSTEAAFLDAVRRAWPPDVRDPSHGVELRALRVRATIEPPAGIHE